MSIGNKDYEIDFASAIGDALSVDYYDNADTTNNADTTAAVASTATAETFYS
jgi:hypothetical protein